MLHFGYGTQNRTVFSAPVLVGNDLEHQARILLHLVRRVVEHGNDRI